MAGKPPRRVGSRATDQGRCLYVYRAFISSLSGVERSNHGNGSLPLAAGAYRIIGQTVPWHGLETTEELRDESKYLKKQTSGVWNLGERHWLTGSLFFQEQLRGHVTFAVGFFIPVDDRWSAFQIPQCFEYLSAFGHPGKFYFPCRWMKHRRRHEHGNFRLSATLQIAICECSANHRKGKRDLTFLGDI